MFVELVGTFVAGIAAALLFWAVNRTLFQRRLPSWLMPALAGGAMLAVTISNEYGWFQRTAGLMPEGFEVAQTVEETAFYRPWTYLVPFTTRFVAVDTMTIRTNPGQPGLRMVELIFYGRWAQVARRAVVFDCTGARRADLTGEVTLAEDGDIRGARWVSLDPGDPVLTTACNAELADGTT